jgi:hypothetical protein
MTELTDIDKKFIDAIRAAVKEKGEDYVYPDHLRDGGVRQGSCQYTVGGEGACIVGKAIQIATGSVYTGGNSNATSVLEFYDVSYEVRNAFARAQSRQDLNATWGEALSEFENRLIEGGHYYPAVDNLAPVS